MIVHITKSAKICGYKTPKPIEESYSILVSILPWSVFFLSLCIVGTTTDVPFISTENNFYVKHPPPGGGGDPVTGGFQGTNGQVVRSSHLGRLSHQGLDEMILRGPNNLACSMTLSVNIF